MEPNSGSLFIGSNRSFDRAPMGYFKAVFGRCFENVFKRFYNMKSHAWEVPEKNRCKMCTLTRAHTCSASPQRQLIYR